MDRDQFAAFIGHFNITRPGEYDVPRKVVLACFDTWEASGSLDPLYDFEDAQSFLWDAERAASHRDQCRRAGVRPPPAKVYTAEELDFIGRFLAGETYWTPADVFESDEIAAIAAHLGAAQARGGAQ